MADRIERKHPRVEINQTIKVTDVINGGDFGELVNATIEGIMLITKREIAVNSIYQFSLALPFELEGINTLTLGPVVYGAVTWQTFGVFGLGFKLSTRQILPEHKWTN